MLVIIVFIDLKMKHIENTRLVIIMYIFFISLVIISHLYIKITSYNFNLTIKSLGFTLLLYIISYSPILFKANVGGNLIKNLDKILQRPQFFILDLAIDFIYPTFFEEYLFRGLLLSALLGFGVSILKANMIQAILFGLVHFNYYPDWGLLCFIPTIQQMLIGFILGKLYLKTKSLTPSIIFHALWNNIPLLLF
jgi:membrane protease YdiL (CAAX protease family)